MTNWVLRYSSKISGHTYLNEILVPILQDVKGFKWLLSDLEFNSTWAGQVLPINLVQDYFFLSEHEFDQLLSADVQIWWGVILGIPGAIDVVIDDKNLPYAEGNDLIWKNDVIQHPSATIEIVCFDSGYTIVKFNDARLSEKFKNYFTEAIALEKFK